MSTRERMQRFIMERDIYLQLCRIQYGYPPRAHARSIGTHNVASIISALFGCGVTLTFFSTIDATIMNYVKPLQSAGADDILATIVSYLMGFASTFIG